MSVAAMRRRTRDSSLSLSLSPVIFMRRAEFTGVVCTRCKISKDNKHKVQITIIRARHKRVRVFSQSFKRLVPEAF